MIALPATLGIENDSLFGPDPETVSALKEELKHAYAYPQSRFNAPGRPLLPIGTAGNKKCFICPWIRENRVFSL